MPAPGVSRDKVNRDSPNSRNPRDRRGTPRDKRRLVTSGSTGQRITNRSAGDTPRANNATVGRAKHRPNPPQPAAPMATRNPPPPPTPTRDGGWQDDDHGIDLRWAPHNLPMRRVNRPSEWWKTATDEERRRHAKKYREVVGGLRDDLSEYDLKIDMLAAAGSPAFDSAIARLVNGRRETLKILAPFLTPDSAKMAWRIQSHIEAAVKQRATPPGGQLRFV